MNYLLDNLSLLYKTSGWTYSTLAAKLNEGLSQNQQFSSDQIRGWEQRLRPPKTSFKFVLAKFFGVDVKEIEEKRLSQSTVIERINKANDEAGDQNLANQYEILANQRVILSLLASMKKPEVSLISDDVRKTLQKMVEEEKEKVLKEKRRRF